jgi:hypothetical protein
MAVVREREHRVVVVFRFGGEAGVKIDDVEFTLGQERCDERFRIARKQNDVETATACLNFAFPFAQDGG